MSNGKTRLKQYLRDSVYITGLTSSEDQKGIGGLYSLKYNEQDSKVENQKVC